MINMDQPIHFELRREHLPFFTQKYVADLKTKVEAKVTTLLDTMAPMGKCDLVEHLSAELPLFTLSEILGIPESDRPKLVRVDALLGDRRLHRGGEEFRVGRSQRSSASSCRMSARCSSMGGRLLLKRRADPRADLLTALAQAKVGGDVLPDEYLDGSWLLIVFAGNDTTRNSISGTMKLAHGIRGGEGAGAGESFAAADDGR